MKTDRDTHIFPTPDALADGAAEFICRQLSRSQLPGGVVRVALSGGSTPAILYRALLSRHRDSLDWSRVHFFWSDERFVAADHPDSNYGLAHRLLLTPLAIAASQIHQVPTELGSALLAAEAYQRDLADHFCGADATPCFDLILLGLGEDGHTASLFPGSKALAIQDRWVAENWIPGQSTWRISFTYPLINAAACVLFLVSGAGKAQVVQEILVQKNRSYPAARVQPLQGRAYWFLDAAAAAGLDSVNSK